MTGRTGRRAALVVAAGLLIFTAVPIRAESFDTAEDAGTGKPVALTKAAKPHAQHASRSRKVKHAVAKVRTQTVAAAKPQLAPDRKLPMPDGIANANALMTSADARGVAEVTRQPPLEAAAAEQRDELDRALIAAPPSAETARVATQLAVAEQPQIAVPAIASEPSPVPIHSASAVSRDTAWAQSSLIGKIFIAFGGVLTLASAARMLVA